MKQSAIYISGLLLLMSCQQPTKKAAVPHIKKDNVNIKAKAALSLNDTLAIPDDTLPKIIIPENTIQVKNNDAGDIIKKIKILACADYNKDDIDPKDAKLIWKGLFNAKSKYYIADTRIKFIRVSTGWHLQSDIKDSNMILMSGMNDVQNGYVKPALTSKRLYAAGQKLEFAYYGITYTLYTTGYKKDGQIYNYKLFLMASVKGHHFNQLLRSLEPGYSFGGVGDMSENVEIEFAGDLDGDKIPDFIITGSGYSYGNTYLYLSKPAGEKAILRLVSSFGVSD